jgi:hypothetical protein
MYVCHIYKISDWACSPEQMTSLQIAYVTLIHIYVIKIDDHQAAGSDKFVVSKVSFKKC